MALGNRAGASIPTFATRWVLLAAAIALQAVAVAPAARAGQDCFTVIVGKDASARGCVLLGHNEDDSPPQIVNHRKVPRRSHGAGERVALRNGGELPQVAETWAYIWSEMPEMDFSDSYVNEWGVAVASDACRSREDRSDLTAGGITYMLRRLVAERARSAREGVQLAGDLVERFGYDSSGRTYAICDPTEGWLFCAVRGRRWLAARVPDDQVAILANTFTVHEVDLQDPDRCRAAADIVAYASSRGWHDPDVSGTFDFAGSYADPENAADSSNVCRQWGGLRLVSATPVVLGEPLPFAVVPRHALDVSDVMRILRDHYEGTDLVHPSAEPRSPHRSAARTICTGATQTSFVAELRSAGPGSTGSVYWVCLGPPCTSVYIPFDVGMTIFPPGFHLTGQQPSDAVYRAQIQARFVADPDRAFWTFRNFHDKVHRVRPELFDQARIELGVLERRAFERRRQMEDAAAGAGAMDAAGLRPALERLSSDIYVWSLESMAWVLAQ